MGWVLVPAALAAILGSFLLYRRREARVPGSDVLAALRAAAVLLILLLLWNPGIGQGPGTRGGRWVLVDVSRSMEIPPVGGGAAPSDRASNAAEGDVVLGFGSGVRPFGEVEWGVPADGRSALAPALRAAAEGGASEVVVVSDLRIDDPVESTAALEAVPIQVEFLDLGGPVRNAGIVELTLPSGFAGRDTIAGEILVRMEGTAGDTATVELTLGGEPLQVLAIPGADEGAIVRAPFLVPRPSTEAPEVAVRADLRLDGDGFAGDDRRTAVLRLTPAEHPLVVVSLRADWEVRFLLPELTRATGLEGRAFTRLSGDRWLPFLEGGESTMSERPPLPGTDSVAAIAGRSEVLVLHGIGEEIPEWISEAAAAANRVIVLADAPAAGALLGVSLQEARPGASWFVGDELPPSPVAAELSGIRTERLPPLDGLLPLARTGAGGTSALSVLREGRGDPESALVVGGAEGRRWALVPAHGFWRWAMREGDGRDAYRRFWSAAAAWVLEGDARAPDAVRPLRSVEGAGEPVPWSAPAGRWRIVVSREDGTVLDTTLVAATGAAGLITPGLEPGSYTWRAEAADSAASDPSASGSEAGSSTGMIEIEERSAELLHPRWAPPEVLPRDGEGTPEAAQRALRTFVLPWILLLGLLFSEWYLRRRRGLR